MCDIPQKFAPRPSINFFDDAEPLWDLLWGALAAVPLASLLHYHAKPAFANLLENALTAP